jgi:N-acetyl-anhydromuramyl-L-alanine amidase AmpD
VNRIDVTAMATARRWARPWTRCTAIVLHQTACLLGERPERFVSSAAHFFVLRSGTVVQVHPIDARTACSSALNYGGIAVEVDGHFEGVLGDVSTYWRPASSPTRQPMRPTPAQLVAALELGRWIVGEVAAHGGQVRHVLAHRQGSATRRSDPGSEIWQGVALPLQAELGLDDGGEGFAAGGGLPIPHEWDPRRAAKY